MRCYTEKVTIRIQLSLFFGDFASQVRYFTAEEPKFVNFDSSAQARFQFLFDNSSPFPFLGTVWQTGTHLCANRLDYIKGILSIIIGDCLWHQLVPAHVIGVSSPIKMQSD